MPITPNGTLTLRRRSPLSSVVCLSTFPSGLGSAATWRMSAAIPSKRAGVSCNRSYSGLLRSIFARSTALASSSSCSFCAMASATWSRMLFLLSSLMSASCLLAWRTLLKVSLMLMIYFCGINSV